MFTTGSRCTWEALRSSGATCNCFAGRATRLHTSEERSRRLTRGKPSRNEARNAFLEAFQHVGGQHDQAIENRKAPVRNPKSRLNEIRELADDKRTDAIKTECATLERELRDSETELRAAIESEELDLSNAAAATHDGESTELRELRGRVNFGHYVTAAAEQRAADGRRALEYNAGARHPRQSVPAWLCWPRPRTGPRRTRTDARIRVHVG